MNKELIDFLSKAHEGIMRKELEIIELTNDATELKEICMNIEMNKSFAVVNLKEDNKPKFGNDISRNSEINRLLNLDNEYLRNQEKLKESNKMLSIRKAELNMFINKQSNYRILAKFFSGDRDGEDVQQVF